MQPRLQKHPYRNLFDRLHGNLPLSERKSTTATLQTLCLLDAGFLHSQAQEMAERWSTGTASNAGFVEGATRMVLGRPPRPDEAERAAECLAHVVGSGEAKCASFLRAMLASNEFLFAD